jgi:hypothetical protein
MRRQLQCNALLDQEKSGQRKNRGKQCEKQGEEQQAKIRASAYGCDAEEDDDATRESLSGGPSLLAEFADEPGRNPLTRIYAISTNGERAQERNSQSEIHEMTK